MSNEYSDPKSGIWQWDQGAFVMQAYTHPIGHSMVLKVKRYTQHDFNSASMAGVHQLLHNENIPETQEELKKILMNFGCPKSLL